VVEELFRENGDVEHGPLLPLRVLLAAETDRQRERQTGGQRDRWAEGGGGALERHLGNMHLAHLVENGVEIYRLHGYMATWLRRCLVGWF